MAEMEDALCISIHALREEGDVKMAKDAGWWDKFLSTPSVRRATGLVLRLHRQAVISIHALREEGDVSCCWFPKTANYFYPRPP